MNHTIGNKDGLPNLTQFSTILSLPIVVFRFRFLKLSLHS